MKPKRRLRLLLVLGLLVVALLLFINPMTFWVILSPRYSEESLRGNTITEVVQKLGPPEYDPRQHGWKNEDEDGPFVFGYRGGWAVCRIEFKGGVVTKVERYAK